MWDVKPEQLDYADALTNRLDCIKQKNQNRRKWRILMDVVGVLIYSGLSIWCAFAAVISNGEITPRVALAVLAAIFLWRAWAIYHDPYIRNSI
jgi:hypothetical protein